MYIFNYVQCNMLLRAHMLNILYCLFTVFTRMFMRKSPSKWSTLLRLCLHKLWFNLVLWHTAQEHHRTLTTGSYQWELASRCVFYKFRTKSLSCLPRAPFGFDLILLNSIGRGYHSRLCTHIARACSVWERAIGLLKCRWRCLDASTYNI